MNDTPPATQQFTSAPAVHDVPPEALARGAATTAAAIASETPVTGEVTE